MSSTTGTPAAGSEKKTTMAAPPARPDSRVAFSIAPLSQPLSTTPTALLNKKAPDDKSDSNDDDSASVLDPNDEVEATSVVRDILRMFDDLKMQVDDANAPEEGEIAADLSDPIDVMSLDDMLLKIVAHIDDDIESVISAPEGGKEEGEVASDDGSLEDVSPDEGRKSAERQSAAIRSTSPMSVIEVKPRVEEIDSNYYSRSRTTSPDSHDRRSRSHHSSRSYSRASITSTSSSRVSNDDHARRSSSRRRSRDRSPLAVASSRHERSRSTRPTSGESRDRSRRSSVESVKSRSSRRDELDEDEKPRRKRSHERYKSPSHGRRSRESVASSKSASSRHSREHSHESKRSRHSSTTRGSNSSEAHSRKSNGQSRRQSNDTVRDGDSTMEASESKLSGCEDKLADGVPVDKRATDKDSDTSTAKKPKVRTPSEERRRRKAEAKHGRPLRSMSAETRSSIFIDRRKLRDIAIRNAVEIRRRGVLPVAAGISKLGRNAAKLRLRELTGLCRDIASETVKLEARDIIHPFEKPADRALPGELGIELNLGYSHPPPANAIELASPRLSFPVSSGMQHRHAEAWFPELSVETDEKRKKKLAKKAPANAERKEAKDKKRKERWAPAEPIEPLVPEDSIISTGVAKPGSTDLNQLVFQRLMFQRQLQEDPENVAVQKQMAETQQMMIKWACDYHGGSQSAMSLAVSSGRQAWTRGDQLISAMPIAGGIGMALLRKMGWQPGSGIGKRECGMLEPLKFLVKLDKKGLTSRMEGGGAKVGGKKSKRTAGGRRTIVATHPCSALNEYCTKNDLGTPTFDEVSEYPESGGPRGTSCSRLTFLYKVTVAGVEYRPTLSCLNKKEARIEAAKHCLEVLGVRGVGRPSTAAPSSSVQRSRKPAAYSATGANAIRLPPGVQPLLLWPPPPPPSGAPPPTDSGSRTSVEGKGALTVGTVNTPEV